MGDYSINSRVGFREIGDAVAIFNCATQVIEILNETGSYIWLNNAKGYSVEDIISKVAAKWGIDRKVAANDTKEFLDELKLSGFLGEERVDVVSDIEDEEGYNALMGLEMTAIKELIPFAVTFEVTNACNESCVHCYMEKHKTSLRTSEISRIITELASAGCLFISFTGGEFFMRTDSMKILECAAQNHFVIDILSNGILITKSIVEKLTQLPVRRVQVSLYGSNAKTHDSITILQGSFERTLASIRLMLELGLKVEIAFPMMKGNFRERYEVASIAKELGCAFSPSPIITARNDGSQDTFAMRIGDEEIKDFLSDPKLAESYAGRKPFEEHQFYLDIEDIHQAPPCYSGFNSAAISPQGIVYPCNQFLYPLGDLKTDKFEDIWENSASLEKIRSVKISDLPKCRGCGLLSHCARCPGLAFLEGGDYYGPSSENCRITKINTTLMSEGR